MRAFRPTGFLPVVPPLPGSLIGPTWRLKPGRFEPFQCYAVTPLGFKIPDVGSERPVNWSKE